MKIFPCPPLMLMLKKLTFSEDEDLLPFVVFWIVGHRVVTLGYKLSYILYTSVQWYISTLVYLYTWILGHFYTFTLVQ